MYIYIYIYVYIHTYKYIYQVLKAPRVMAPSASQKNTPCESEQGAPV